MRLNLGCGNFAMVGWTNVDLPEAIADPAFVRPPAAVELVAAPMRALPFADGSAEQVYCGHVLEHIELGEPMTRTLLEVRRVMEPDGELMVVGPCIERAKALGYGEETLEDIRGRGARWPGDGHAWLPTEDQHVELLEEAGFEVQRLSISDVPVTWPVVSRVGWQFALSCY